MQTIDLTKGIGYSVLDFPDGEKHLVLKELNRKESVKVTCRISNSDDLFLLMQLADILNRQEVCVEKLSILYLMGMRCDRLFSLEQPFSLKIVANVVNSLNAELVEVCEPHSEASLRLINNSFGTYLSPLPLTEDKIYCFPDKGAKERYSICVEAKIKNPITCSKVRDVSTGRLTGFAIEDKGDSKEGREIIVVDDLCDGGGTFCGIVEQLRKLNPKSITLSVTHAVQRGGIVKTATVYDRVIITNSYKDWNLALLPDNVELRDITSEEYAD